ncbi:hypothetical protein [Allomesorhizobium camelthorni]|uniref:Uncharacterized protein n=1 Tax=Allomesorhizobium camelthorni TaxID=475069 RepID=A0A6G4WIS9_9HYPH|nr:hypothetical protein [Mesorhizobium camelthorni]NGO54103.1 hypothetical protein [Mesorhizobium camelthorni]
MKKTINLSVLRSQQHIITVIHNSVRYKLFQILFSDDGSMYVNFPYYRKTTGFAGKLQIPAGSVSHQVNLTDCAKLTSHLVKYAHHLSGQAHFSLTGKVKTEIKKQSVPIQELNGHIFTAMLQGIDGFEQANGKKYDHGWSDKRTTVEFNLGTIPIETIKFVAIMQPLHETVKGVRPIPNSNAIGPKFVYPKEGEPGLGFLLAPPESNPLAGHILQLRLHMIPHLDAKEDRSFFMLMGGFDPLEKIHDTTQSAECLVLSYPAENVDELKKAIGSIDLEEV